MENRNFGVVIICLPEMNVYFTAISGPGAGRDWPEIESRGEIQEGKVCLFFCLTCIKM